MTHYDLIKTSRVINECVELCNGITSSTLMKTVGGDCTDIEQLLPTDKFVKVLYELKKEPTAICVYELREENNNKAQEYKPVSARITAAMNEAYLNHRATALRWLFPKELKDLTKGMPRELIPEMMLFDNNERIICIYIRTPKKQISDESIERVRRMLHADEIEVYNL